MSIEVSSVPVFFTMLDKAHDGVNGLSAPSMFSEFSQTCSLREQYQPNRTVWSSMEAPASGSASDGTDGS